MCAVCMLLNTVYEKHSSLQCCYCQSLIVHSANMELGYVQKFAL